MTAISDSTVRLLDYDPDLALSLAPERRDEARRRAVASTAAVQPGLWDPRATAADGSALAPYGLFVLEGLISHTVQLADVSAVQLLGRGDLILPTDDAAAAEFVPTAVRWAVLEPTTFAVLDERFLLAIRRWPELTAALFERVARRFARLRTHQAVCQLPRVEDRIHAVLWFLAERWGRISPHGVVLPLRLTHELLGQLIGAKRPTVSLAIKALEAEGRVRRRADGAWLLEQAWASPGATEPADPAAAGFVVGGGGDGDDDRSADHGARASRPQDA